MQSNPIEKNRTPIIEKQQSSELLMRFIQLIDSNITSFLKNPSINRDELFSAIQDLLMKIFPEKYTP